MFFVYLAQVDKPHALTVVPLGVRYSLYGQFNEGRPTVKPLWRLFFYKGGDTIMSIDLLTCKLQIRTKAGTLSSGGDKVVSVMLTGIRESAEASALLAIKDALADVLANTVLDVRRIDENLVSAA